MSRIVFAVACAAAMFLVFIGMAVKESCNNIGQCGGLEDEEEKDEEDAEEDAP